MTVAVVLLQAVPSVLIAQDFGRIGTTTQQQVEEHLRIMFENRKPAEVIPDDPRSWFGYFLPDLPAVPAVSAPERLAAEYDAECLNLLVAWGIPDHLKAELRGNGDACVLLLHVIKRYFENVSPHYRCLLLLTKTYDMAVSQIRHGRRECEWIMPYLRRLRELGG